ncbi:uncharacterized protein K460DRAFT_286690, partial [Cucurbitaria berberidis CBS 394.84]
SPTRNQIEFHTAAKMHPAIIVVLVIGALSEMWVVFAVSYAALQRDDGRGYYRRVTDALRFKL